MFQGARMTQSSGFALEDQADNVLQKRNAVPLATSANKSGCALLFSPIASSPFRRARHGADRDGGPHRIEY